MPIDASTPPNVARRRAPWISAALASLLVAAGTFFPLDRESLPQLARLGGRLHPMVLHLPIGLLVALAGLEVLRRLRRAPGLDAACAALLWMAAVSAVVTALAGALLSTEGGYEAELLSSHRWLGAATAIAVVWLLALRPSGPASRSRRLGYAGLLIATLAVLVAAGHQGASLTHGSDYLTRFLPSFGDRPGEVEESAAVGAEDDPQHAVPFEDLDAYPHVVARLLADRCVGCHGPEKSKADLRLDSHAALMAGGENGPVVVPSAPADSTLAEVLLLPAHDDRHMPPDGKPQLTSDELDAILWWIESGAPETGRLGDLWIPPVRERALRAVLERGRVAVAEAAPAVSPADDPTPGESAPAVDLDPDAASDPVVAFEEQVGPLLAHYCFRCHGEEEQKGGIRLDVLDPDMLDGPDAEGWHTALDMIHGGEMPPEDESQMSDEERRLVVAWMTDSLEAVAEARRGARHAVIRRLTRAQYTNTLQDLLGLDVDFGRVLPEDGKSELGFTNSGDVLQSSPLHIDYYRAIAREALEQAIAVGPRPQPVRYRIIFGKGIGEGLVAGRTGGYQSVPLSTDDFIVEILDAEGRPKDESDEREKAALDEIRRRISIGLRGSSQDRFRVVDEGMILFSALPHVERAPKSWQGPSPNVKLEMQRVFPEKGDFVMRVRASRGYIPPTQEQLLVPLDEPVALAMVDASGAVTPPDGAIVLQSDESDERKNVELDGGTLVPVAIPEPSSARFRVVIPRDGFYQIDLVHPVVSADAMPSVRLRVDDMSLDMRPELTAEQQSLPRAVTPLGVAGLREGRHQLRVGGPFFVGCSHVVVTPLTPEHGMVKRLSAKAEALTAKLADKVPAIRAFVGTRTDDGMDYQTFDEPMEVTAPLGAPETYTFRGRLEDLPIPEPESGDTEVLSGFMLLGLWNDHLVKAPDQTGPPLLVESIEFEAPYWPVWPPKSHTDIFFDSPDRDDEDSYTRAVVTRFMERAFRRTLLDVEVERYMEFWRQVRDEFPRYEDGVREVLIAVLCSPNFLYLAEPLDARAEDGTISDEALAARLSYFLWNSPPDATLRDLARDGRLRDELLDQVDRMLDDPRAERFVRVFAREWLRLDRLEGMTINVGVHPAYTRFVKRDMAEETYRFCLHVLREDLSIETLIDSDFAMLNQNLAEFYGIDGVMGPEFRPVPITPEQRRGGLLSQGAFLSGHSDGTSPHPIKRAVWLKEKILGDPPPPPPPNVPDLDPETPGFEKLTLEQQLEVHRDKPSCVDCHAGIDPYGLVFERYSAVGLHEDERRGLPIDAESVLPDGTDIDGVDELKAWLLGEKRDDFAASLIEHLYAYALGRGPSFVDDDELARILAQVKVSGYRMRAVIRAIVTSPSFSEI